MCVRHDRASAGLSKPARPPVRSTSFVTYAKQDADREDDVAGQGLGFVDAFETAGHLLGRVATRGQLYSSWGLALAPSTFGRFQGDLLVGNFGDGRINAYAMRPNGTFEHRGTLRRANGRTTRAMASSERSSHRTSVWRPALARRFDPPEPP